MAKEKKPTVGDLVDYSWKSGILEWKLDELQAGISKKINNSGSKKVLVLSSRQIGKSFWSCVYALEFLIQNPGTIARIVAPTLDQCHDIVNDNLNKIIEDAPSGIIIRQKSELRWQLSNGSSLRLGGLKRAHVDSNRGGNASLVIYEESGFVDAEDFNYGVDSVLGPQLLRSSGTEIFVSTPSEDPNHPMHTRIKPDCEDLGSFFSFSVYDSPSITSRMIDEAIRRCGGFDTESFQREYMAKIIRPSSLMVVPFETSRHTVVDPAIPPRCKWFITIDWGGVRDFTVGLLHTYDFLTDKDIILDEVVFGPNTPTEHIVKGLKNFSINYGVQVESVYADVSGQLQVDLSSTHKFPVSIPTKYDWLAGINTMVSRFSQNKILIDKKCKFLIKSCNTAMFNKTRTDFERNNDIGHCDAIAALMYALRSQNRQNPYIEKVGSNFYANHPSFFIPIQQPDMENVIDFGFAKTNYKFKKFGNVK